ncbi:MAG: hypothetical protein RR639_04175 [Hydrogenoanaerobacterium sp.]
MDNIDIVQEISNRISAIYELAIGDCNMLENKDGSVSLMLRSKLVMRLCPHKKHPFLLTNEAYANIVSGCGFTFSKTKLSPNFVKVIFGDLRLDRNAINLIEKILSRAIETYTDGSFGCCHRYVECSNNLKCTHPDKLYSSACQYKHNLMNGKIFYGVNATIPTK